MINPTFSVVLCSYNGAEYIDAQLASIFSSKQMPDEVLIFDDGSTDSTTQICAAWRARYPQVLRWQRNPNNLGVTQNFAAGLAKCRGDLIFLCDQDDLWFKHKLERMLTEFQRRPDLFLLHSDAQLVDSKGADLHCTLFNALEVSRSELNAIHSGRGFSTLLRRNIVTGATTALRQRLLDWALPIPPDWVHDEWLGLIAAAGAGIDVLEESLIAYRQHSNNQIGSKKLSLLDKLRKALAPRTINHAGHVRRMTTLLARLREQQSLVPTTHIDLVEEKLLHHRICARLPSPRLLRLRPVIRELSSGRYGRCTNGLRSIVHDLLGPV